MALAEEQAPFQPDGSSQPRTPIRIMVVDDHAFFRSGVIAWLGEQAGVECCGEAGTLAEAREILAMESADLLLLDLGLPDGDGVEFIGEAIEQHPLLRVIVLSQRDEAVFAERAIKQGARGYLMKSEASEVLHEAIHAVMDGRIWLSRAAQAQADPLESAQRLRQEHALGDLSDRELQVFALLGAGYGPKDIAGRLGISTKTVEAHREHMRHKLGLTDSAALTRLAGRWVQTGRI